MKKMMTTFFAVAVLAMAANAFAQQNSFFVEVQDKLDNSTEAVNNGFVNRVAVGVEVSHPTVAFVGDKIYVTFTITNHAGRAIPDLTAWVNPVAKKLNKDGSPQYDGGYISGGQIVACDSLGNPLYNYSLSDGASLEFTVGPFIPEKTGPFVIDTIEIWTRLGNKNFQDQLHGSLRGDKIVINVIPQAPGFPDGISPDGNGGLYISGKLLNNLVPNNDKQGMVIVKVLNKENEEDWASHEITDPTQVNTNQGNGIHIMSKGIYAGIYEISVEKYPKVNGAGNVQDVGGTASLSFELFLDAAGNPIGAKIIE
ncbi:MAG: hypothetical protein FWC50_04780 [Planctomycetaceae bacterium]|nr:hypothetical protein [Planctomycetaceae bacterium]